MRSYRADFNSTSLSEIRKKTTPHNDFTANFHSALSNPQVMQIRLPSLDQLNFKRSIPLVVERNTKNRLHNLHEKLNQLSIEMHNTRMDAKQTSDTIKYTKTLLIDKTLIKFNEDLKEQMAGLKKLVTHTRKSNENRSNQLREGYIRLWNQTESLKQKVFYLTLRTDKLNDSMGYQM